MKQLTKPILKAIFLLFATVPAANALGQEVYHLDPNKTYGMTPDKMSSASPTTTVTNEIVIANNNKQDFSILVSDDNANWKTVSIKANGSMDYTDKIKYVKVYTTETKMKHYKLVNGFSYSITWDSANQVWILK